MVSYGLLTEIDVAGRGPGELVRPRGELAVRIRVQGPGWTRAEQVALYVNGTPVREEAIPGGTDAGLKWEATWRLAAPAHDVHVVAVATGPGVTAPYWPTAKPYQPTSTTLHAVCPRHERSRLRGRGRQRHVRERAGLRAA